MKENGDSKVQYGDSWRFLVSPKKGQNKEKDIIKNENKKIDKKVNNDSKKKNESKELKDEDKKKGRNKEKHIKFKGILA